MPNLKIYHLRSLSREGGSFENAQPKFEDHLHIRERFISQFISLSNPFIAPTALICQTTIYYDKLSLIMTLNDIQLFFYSLTSFSFQGIVLFSSLQWKFILKKMVKKQADYIKNCIDNSLYLKHPSIRIVTRPTILFFV